MSDMKCPFCQQELEQITTSNPLGLGRVVYYPTQDEALAYLVGFLCENVAKAYNELYKTDEQAEQKDK